ncbi:MAG: hypothetical protein ACRD8W_18190, partial [Nitrososphaeraceae archaeon]
MHIAQLWPTWVPKLRSPQFVIIVTLFFLLTALVATEATSGVDSAISLYASNIPPGSDMVSTLII